MTKNNKYYLVIIFLLMFRLAFAQLPDIIAMEYYFDSDPGYGNAIAVPLAADSIIDFSFDADLSLINSGFHILYVRVKDEYGNWSFVFIDGFLKPINSPAPATSGLLPQITKMEYFFDTDPGFGNGIDVPITSDSLVDVDFDVDLSLVPGGFHIIYARVKDAYGNWSFVLTKEINKTPDFPLPVTPAVISQITQLEYFFDADPGFGNGTDIPVNSDSLIDVAFDADLSALNAGFHILYIRVKDENKNWSITHTEGFLKFPNPIAVATPGVLPQIVQMEYFFDADPGFGNGTDIPVNSDSLIDVAFDADLSALNAGFHILYIRVKDENKNWSITHTKGFLKFPNPIAVATPGVLTQIVQMEYFFDADPGFVNGTEIPITSDSLIEIAFDADVSLLDNGLHNLYVRVKDENGNWSLLYSDDTFKFSPPTAGVSEQLPDIVSMEYFFNIDPGFGNGTEIFNTPDSLILENLSADISQLGPGKHLMYSRVKDENNRWSFATTSEFYIKGLHLFLEGPYDSITGLMSTNLNDQGLLPLEQPFDSDLTAVWYYDGNETVTSIPKSNVVDWLLLQARDATSAASATLATVKENRVAFLLNNGKIVGLDGESLVTFSEPIENDLYLVVFQRNHLGVISSSPLDTEGEFEYTYSFTNGFNQAYGGENGQKEVGSGVWGMISGDGDGNGQVTTEDKNVAWKSEAGNAAYLSGDFNLDGQVDNDDKNDLWLSNDGNGSEVPE